MPHRITEGPAAGQMAVDPAEFDRIVEGIESPVGTPLAEDWDAFWAEADRPPAASVVIKGRLITLPPKMSLRIERLFIEIQSKEATIETMRPLMAAVLGVDLIDWFIDDVGADDEQMQVLMFWAMGNLAGKPTTLQQARQAVIAAEGAGDGPGNVPPLAKRPADRKPSRRSSGTGRRSSSTSARSGG